VTLAAQTCIPNNDLVGVAWVKAVLDQSGGVGTTLRGPDDDGTVSWSDTGFVQLRVAGGSSNLTINQKLPIYIVDCYAAPAKPSGRPPWNSANALAEAIRHGCYTTRRQPPRLNLGAGYPPAFVKLARFVAEPRRIGGDDSAYARYQFHLELTWVTDWVGEQV
jgi:hypothetical protein